MRVRPSRTASPARLGQRRDVDEPLERQARLDHGLAARAVADAVEVGALLGDDPALGAQRRDDRGPRLEPVEPSNGPADGDHTAFVHHRQGRQVVAAADLEVVGVVGRGDLDRAGAERRVDVVVGDDRDAAAGQRQLDLAADQVGVALVGGVDRDGGVTEHGLGAGGGDDDRVGALAVADRDELALVLLVFDLDVRQRGQAAGAPVDDAVGPVDEAVVEEPLEDRLDGPRQALVHREALAGPVDAVAELGHLAEDPAARLFLPLPDPVDEGLAAEVVAREAFLGQLALDDVLRRDSRVVHAGQPRERPCPACGPGGSARLGSSGRGRGRHGASRSHSAAGGRCCTALARLPRSLRSDRPLPSARSWGPRRRQGHTGSAVQASSRKPILEAPDEHPGPICVMRTSLAGCAAA